MKTVFYIFQICVLFFTFCKANSNNDSVKINQLDARNINIIKEVQSLFFIGYINSYPIFNDIESNKLYISKKTGIIESYYDYKTGLIPKFINDTGIILFNNSTYELTIRYFNGQEQVVNLEKLVLYLTSDDKIENIYYEDDVGNVMKLIVNEKKIGFIAKGGLPYYVNDNLFYGEPYTSSNSTYWNIYKINPRFPDEKELILNGIQGDPWILTGSKYLVCYPQEGGKLSIYNIDNKMFTVINSKEVEVNSFYSYQEKAVIFYNPDTFNMVIVKPE